PDDGTVTVTPPADATPGTSVDIPVKVTYPDGSSEETPVKVTVQDTKKDIQNRTYQWKCHKRKIQMYHQEQHLRYHQQVFQKAG
ncbi:YPDG domain-containing protein, partial [Staphylococcus pseudintermedius]|uniref:YPDG domain-containing protein n=1 Tax=Staphylococcus pseudintermedius TaxID=283734 RepID=UPI0036F302CA